MDGSSSKKGWRGLTILKGDDARALPEGVSMILCEKIDKGRTDFGGRPVCRVGEFGGLRGGHDGRSVGSSSRRGE
jgi:hypothetical protein